MDDQHEGQIIHIIFTRDDIESIAEECEVDLMLALERAEDWASAIEDTAVQLITDQLYSVIEFDNP